MDWNELGGGGGMFGAGMTSTPGPDCYKQHDDIINACSSTKSKQKKRDTTHLAVTWQRTRLR